MSMTNRSFGGAAAANRGFTLIEILVALLVLSVGLLGLAALQATALKNNNSAAARSQATFLAYDIIDRMRANRAAAESGDYDVALTTAPSGATNCQTNTSSCTETQMATFDRNQWKCLLGNWVTEDVCANTHDIDRGLLPDGDGAIAIDGSQRVTITISWTDGTDPDPVVLTVNTQL